MTKIKSNIIPKERYGLKYRGTLCLNCEHPLDISDKYCPNCSQTNSTKKLTLKDFFDEFLSSLISYDSKLLKTLTALLLKPGSITKEYLNGKRVSFTNPFRFLLSLGIIYFLIINYSGDFTKYNKDNNLNNYYKSQPQFLFKNLEDQNNNQLLVDSLNLGNDIKNAIKEISTKDSTTLSNPLIHYKNIDTFTGIERYLQKEELFRLLLANDKIHFVSDLENYNIGSSEENTKIFNISKNLEKAITEPGTFISYLISKLPFVVFFFLPIFALFILLIYIRKKYTYTDHLVFSFHNQSLLFILLIISFVIDAAFKVNSGWIFIFIFSIYLFSAMRKFYKQGIFKTIIKYLFLNFIFFTLASITMLLLITGSVLTF